MQLFVTRFVCNYLGCIESEHPGIKLFQAYDQPDVYESGDLPEADQSEENSDEENECIEKMHISVSDSFKKFKGKQVQGSVDFSDRISRKIRTGYK